MIELSHVSKQFNGKRQVTALADVSLRVAPGELVSIVGPLGSGKSTLLNLIGALDQPTAGDIRIGNASLARVDAFRGNDVIRRIAYRRVENVQGIWTARELEVTDLGRNSRTILTLERLEYNVPMREDDFSLQALRRQ